MTAARKRGVVAPLVRLEQWHHSLLCLRQETDGESEPGVLGMASREKDRWVISCKKVLLVVIGVPLLAVLVLFLVALARTTITTSPAFVVPSALTVETKDLIDPSNIDARTKRLSGALQIDTTSNEPGDQAFAGLLQLHDFIETSFPTIHSSSFISREVVNNYSLLYTIEGSQPGKLPYILASHLDAVPANPATWEVPPFSGAVVNNTYIYGRGAMDDKSGVMGILEGLEYLLVSGQRPKRSFFLCFGHDEEIGGTDGALGIASTLLAKGITKVDFVLDEGFPVSYGMLTQTDRKVAIIGVSEKGSANLQLSVTGTPSHSSFPPKASSIGILGAALGRLEANPQPAHLEGSEADTFNYLLPYMDFKNKLFYSNMWLFSKRVISVLSDMSFTNAIVRTTTAVTIFKAGVKENVVPPLATAHINHRVHPSQTVAEAVAYDKQIINDDRVKITILDQREALPVSPYSTDDALPFQLVATSIKQVYTDAIVVPGVLIGNTDTRWYVNFTKHLFRFLPTIVNPVDSLRYHGNNERIAIDHYQKAVNFFYRVIKNADLMMDAAPLDTNV